MVKKLIIYNKLTVLNAQIVMASKIALIVLNVLDASTVINVPKLIMVYIVMVSITKATISII